jgi:hypothetical protein
VVHFVRVWLTFLCKNQFLIKALSDFPFEIAHSSPTGLSPNSISLIFISLYLLPDVPHMCLFVYCLYPGLACDFCSVRDLSFLDPWNESLHQSITSQTEGVIDDITNSSLKDTSQFCGETPERKIILTFLLSEIRKTRKVAYSTIMIVKSRLFSLLFFSYWGKEIKLSFWKSMLLRCSQNSFSRTPQSSSSLAQATLPHTSVLFVVGGDGFRRGSRLVDLLQMCHLEGIDVY